MSLDGTTWIQLTPSHSSKTTVNNLESNTDYYFQNRTVAAHIVYGEWSQSVLITVK